jgi:3-hydroxybutyryl-CoA dehydrogenase
MERRQWIMAGSIKKVAVLGMGNLGVQIALQAAACGYEVIAYSSKKQAINRFLDSLDITGQPKGRHLPIDLAQWPKIADKIKIYPSIKEAVASADIVIEVVPEDLEIKLDVWREMDTASPEHAILATNSSSIPVSQLEKATSRPEKCLNIHFYQLKLGVNIADIMGGTRTTDGTLDTGKKFVRSLGVLPLNVKKELLGFCFNRVWRAVKKEVLFMWAEGYVDHQDVDKAWMIWTGAPWGPFILMDTIGLDVIWDIEMVYYNDTKDPKDHPPQALKDMIKSGHLGVKTGRGFYTYPNPEFKSPNFLKP